MPPPLTFIVSVFKFFDRKDLETISKIGNYVNRIVRKHFASKPYRLLNDVTLGVCRNEYGLAVTLLSEKYAENESSGSQDAENQSIGSQDSENQSLGNQDAENESTGSQDAEIQSSGTQNLEYQSFESQDSENQSSGTQDLEYQSIGSQDSENQSSGSQDAEIQSTGNQDAEIQSTGSHDVEIDSSGSQDSENQYSGSQDAENQSSGSQDAENQSSGVLCFNPYKNEWQDERKEAFDLEIMCPYLNQFVRFGEAQLFCEDYSYTPEDMMILTSISHVWSGRLLWLSVSWEGIENRLEPPMNFRNNASNSFHNILSNDAIFSTRYLDLYNAAKFVSLHDYSRVYTVDVLLLKSYDDDDEHLNIATLLALIEHKSQFPESTTVFVVDISTFQTGEAELTDAIRKRFSSASTQCSFQLVIIDDESNGENEEFRLENENTREVLQLKNVEKDSLFVTRICEICNHEQFHEKFILIERSRI